MVDTPSPTTVPSKELSPWAQRINEVAGKLQELLTKNEKALPKNFNKTRFLQNTLAVLLDVPNLEKCTAVSVAQSVMKGVYLGLDFFRRECYIIPYEIYKDYKPTGIYSANFQTDYKGEIKLCHKYSVRKIQDIYAKLVRKGDDLEIGIKDNMPMINFKPINFNEEPIVGIVAVCRYEDGGILYDTMSVKETEETRKNYSKAPDSPAYKKSLGEMYKKIGLRRLTKLITLDFESHEQLAAYEEGSVVDPKKIAVQVPIETQLMDPFANQAQQVVDPDADLRKKLQKQYPTEEPWQIDARIKDHKGQS